ncbi:serine/threonine-protein kinase [Streptomyces triticirhizae]|uniref:Protein kinase family protein n=1 Tax=Streptomyces triticirhizae TaxID=2483353 RepID=A0A3M2LRF2_9ACTN|nr:serine/threonine-protein kinase [Streptomyces triticirhizae]RMI39470.1 protein kinase family protein [Streptomyces triticirhizae]
MNGREARLTAHAAVATSLALCGGRELRERVDGAQPLGTGIGGTSALLDIEGTPVFVKQVRLTDLERRPENVHSTANLFALPAFCHYGIGTVGSPGLGAWRELAVHVMTTNWVLAGEHEGFPLTHHWRVLPAEPRPLPEELADVERAVAYWGGGTEIRRRIEALRDSSARLVLFLEYLPATLHHWLDKRIAAGGAEAERACAMVERELDSGISFMNAQGLLHLDAHFENILTDGRRLYFADFGLALSSRFQLAPDEADFLHRHLSYDRRYAATYLVNWLSVALYGHPPEERAAFVRACARGDVPENVSAGVAALLARHAPVAEVMGEFFRRFRRESRATPLPPENVSGTHSSGGLGS